MILAAACILNATVVGRGASELLAADVYDGICCMARAAGAA